MYMCSLWSSCCQKQWRYTSQRRHRSHRGTLMSFRPTPKHLISRWSRAVVSRCSLPLSLLNNRNCRKGVAANRKGPSADRQGVEADRKTVAASRKQTLLNSSLRYRPSCYAPFTTTGLHHKIADLHWYIISK